ncbi:MAG: S8 family serine peptidase [Lentisphaeria bacterium]|nr:S8 family serine peptidase [Lentisphaeria bacterium]
MNILNPKINFDSFKSNTGKGITVAVVDSGVDSLHPILQGMVKKSVRVYKEGDQVIVEEIPVDELKDDFGHGTAVAGVLQSIAPDIEIINVKVLNEFNMCTGDILIKGIEWALEQKPRIINMSLATSKKVFFPDIMNLCEKAYEQNTIMVASRRNFGDLGCPAMFSSVISVEIGKDFEDIYDLRYKNNTFIECDALGEKVKLPTPNNEGFSLQTGTSFATPHVTAFVALILESYPDLATNEVKTILKYIQNKGIEEI